MPTARWVPRCAHPTEQTLSSTPKSQSLVTYTMNNLLTIHLQFSVTIYLKDDPCLPCCCMHSTSKHNCPTQLRGHYVMTNLQGSGRSRPAKRAHPAPTSNSEKISAKTQNCWHRDYKFRIMFVEKKNVSFSISECNWRDVKSFTPPRSSRGYLNKQNPRILNQEREGPIKKAPNPIPLLTL